MKIIHTGDWHIGKIVNEFSMIEDQRYILNSLVALIKREKPDVLVIAGDIYDRSIPPVEAVELLNEIFSKVLIEHKVKIIAISGNHDSGERVAFGSEILAKKGLYISGIIENEIKKVTLKDQLGEINFYLVPYVDPAVIRRKYENPDIKNHNDAMVFHVRQIEKNMDKSARNVLVAHGYVTLKREEAIEAEGEDKYKLADIKTSDSERPLSIGGTDLIDGKIFENFDYVALGHLHGRQKIGRDTIRYSGSLLKYSFSEINHKNGVTIVEFNGDKEPIIRQEELIPIRNMRIIKGPIKDLIKTSLEDKCNEKDYIQAILTDEGKIMDPIGKLRGVYPNIMLLKREEKSNIRQSETSASKGYKNKSELELFKEFYNRIGTGEMSANKEAIIKDVIDQVLKGERDK
ncbi:exonuclease SbcCD subunit D [Clostridium vincentii]|uniref:Nuclease SbcCD subunit D n=1 Tax=Clostridium vincentii TaxID=52704 RepID=A0A2T0BCF2_9CLOT|nr:exonuclease SbcCD subunit D [Clostridium vincentii]PRR81576.1 Nuclease SbcCD subunit D [Clostridium vincentii]